MKAATVVAMAAVTGHITSSAPLDTIGIAQGNAFLHVAIDVLEDDDRVVDQHAGDHHEADQRQGVDRDVEDRKQHQRSEERKRHADDREHRVAKADREPENEDHEHDAEHAGSTS